MKPSFPEERARSARPIPPQSAAAPLHALAVKHPLRLIADGKGQQTTYTYDADGRVTGIGYAGGNHVGYAYDANGNLTAMTDSAGTTSYSYDAPST